MKLSKLIGQTLVGLFVCTGLCSHAFTQVVVEGTFKAEKICAANKRLTSDNPGDIMTEVGREYSVVGKNKDNASHYLIIVSGAEQTELRWVDVACGTAELTSGSTDGDTSGYGPIEPGSIENVLAASWQPTFCATERGQSKVECQSQTADRPYAKQFSIHGLWPDDLDDTKIFPCYCDAGPAVSCRRRLPNVTDMTISMSVRTTVRLKTLDKLHDIDSTCV